jgi:hypothetical protein
MALFLLAWQPFAQAGDTGGDPDSREEEAGRVDIKPYYPSPADKDYLHEGPDDDPGWYVNVNWDDDDKDGWDPNDNPPGGVYTADKSDALVSGNGCTQDDDLWKFTVEIVPASIHGPVRLTFNESKVKVYRNRDKQNPFGSGNTVNFTGQPVPLYLEGIAGTDHFREVCMTGEYRGATSNVADDTIHITVFEVLLTAQFSGMQPDDCGVKFQELHCGSNRCGRISWNDKDGNGTTGDNDNNCQGFHNNMVTQGTVKPSNCGEIVTFDFFREVWGKAWVVNQGEYGWRVEVDETGSWHNDDTGPNHQKDEDLTPSNDQHIYQVDVHGCWDEMEATFGHTQLFGTSNFRDCCRVLLYETGYRCSGYLKWKSQFYVKPLGTPPGALNRAGATPEGPDEDSGWNKQILGEGWMAIPSSPPSP